MADQLIALRDQPDSFWIEYDKTFAFSDSPDLEEMLEGLREGFRDQRVAYRAESLAADLQAKLPEPQSPEDPDDPLAALLLHLSATSRVPEALGFVLALAVVGRVRVREAAMLAAVRFRVDGVREPSWAGVIGRPRFERALHATAVTGEMTNLILQFAYGHRVHALVLLIDRTEWARGGLKDAWSVELADADELERQFGEQEAMVRLDERAVAEMLDAALAVPARPEDEEAAATLPGAIQLLAARRRILQPELDLEAPVVIGAQIPEPDADLLDSLLGPGRFPRALLEVVDGLGSDRTGLELLHEAVDVLKASTGPWPIESLRAFQWFLDAAAEGRLELTASGYLRPVLLGEAMNALPALVHSSYEATRETDVDQLYQFRLWLQSAGLLRETRKLLQLTEIGRRARLDPTVLWERIAAALAAELTGVDIRAQAQTLLLLRAASGAEVSWIDITDLLASAGWQGTNRGAVPLNIFRLPVWHVLMNLADGPAISPAGVTLAGHVFRLATVPEDAAIDGGAAAGSPLGLDGPTAAPGLVARLGLDLAGPASFFGRQFTQPTLLTGNTAPHRFVLRVDLHEASPPVWRRLAVSSRMTLEQLHTSLQAAMGWQDYHLHQFKMGPERKDYWTAAFRTDHTDLDDDGAGTLHERDIRLHQVLAKPGHRLFYEYDFGDSWELTLKLEKVEPWPAGSPLVRCLTGRRAGPPEDCGGMGGFAEIVEWFDGGPLPPVFDSERALQTWLPPGWLPTEFDTAALNQDLTDLFGASGSVPTEPGDRRQGGGHRTAALPGSGRWRADLASLLEQLRGGNEGADLVERFASLPSAPEVPVDLSVDLRAWNWFLDRAQGDGIPLTAAGYLKPADVEMACQVVPSVDHWIGKKNREDLTAPLLDFRESLQAMKLLRKYKGRLVLTRLGAVLHTSDELLWNFLAGQLIPDGPGFDTDASLLTLAVAAVRPDQDAPLDLVARALTQIGYGRRSGGAVRPHDLWDLGCWNVLGNLPRHVPSADRRLDRRHHVTAAAASLAHTALLVDPGSG